MCICMYGYICFLHKLVSLSPSPDDVLCLSFQSILSSKLSLYNHFNKKIESQNFMSCQVFIRSMWARFKMKVPIPGRKSFICFQPLLPDPIQSPLFSTSLSWKFDLSSLYQQLPCLWLLTEFDKRRLSQETRRRRAMASSPRLLPRG